MSTYPFYSIEEAKQFSFYRLPKTLFTDETFAKITTDAKLLYSILLDRVSLSIKNNWIDAAGHAYIYYGMEQACRLLHCSLRKCKDLYQELEEIGLIIREARGFGKAHCIYVMHFISQKAEPMNGKKRKFDYITTKESEQYAFYTVPKALLEGERFQQLPVSAKLLYAILLDRLYLSAKNNIADKENRVFIYFKIAEAMEMLHFSNKTCINLFAILEEAGLIIRKVQGRGKPAIIYVLSFIQKDADNDDVRSVNFAPMEENKTCNICTNDRIESPVKADMTFHPEEIPDNCKGSFIKPTPVQVQTCNICTNGSIIPAPLEMNFLHQWKCNFCTNRSVKSAPMDMYFLHTNNINISHTDLSHTDLQQQQIQSEKDVVVNRTALLDFIKEPLQPSELEKIYTAANGNIELIQEKYKIMKTRPIRNVVGFLLTAIQRDFQPPQSSDASLPPKKNRFINYEQREWDFQKLEQMERERLHKISSEVEIEKTLEVPKNQLLPQIDALKSKIDYDTCCKQFPFAAQKIDNLLETITLVLSSNKDLPVVKGEPYVQRQIKKISEKLNYSHIRYMVQNWMDKSNIDIFYGWINQP